jgi:hypothetical protein
MRLSMRSPYALCALALIAIVGCGRAPAPPALDVDGTSLPISGPYTHRNVSVFLIHATEQDSRPFITLDEGLESGIVKVTEGPEGQVSKLEIDNQSDFPLFLHEGDRLSGGKQDRTIYSSLVVPPHSGKTPLPAFCIEQSRWSAGADGASFKNVANFALAPKEVRAAGKIHNDQAMVWSRVRAQKTQAQLMNLARNDGSSLNETLDAPKVKELSDEFAQALGSALVANPNAVGVAIAVNGKIEEVNIYPNHRLLAKLFPRLLQSYALQATLQKDAATEVPEVTVEAVVAFMREGEEKQSQTRDIDERNRMQVVEFDTKVVECRTNYAGKIVHYQRLSDAAKAGRAGSLGVNLENDEIGLDPSVQRNYNVERIEDVTVPGPVNPAEQVKPDVKRGVTDNDRRTKSFEEELNRARELMKEKEKRKNEDK